MTQNDGIQSELRLSG